MRVHKLILPVLLTALLAGCTSSEAPSVAKSEVIPTFTVTGLQTDKTEKYVEYAKRTDITYRTRGRLELKTSGETASRLRGNAFLQFVDSSGFDEEGTIPQFVAVPIMNRIGEFDFERERSIKAGQVYPPAPKYDFSIAGVDEIEYGESVAQVESPSGSQVGPASPRFELRLTPVELIEEENKFSDSSLKSFSSRAFLRVIVRDPALTNVPLIAYVRVTTNLHPDRDKIGKASFQGLVVPVGESSMKLTEYLGDKRPDVLPQYDVAFFGFQRIASARLKLK